MKQILDEFQKQIEKLYLEHPEYINDKSKEDNALNDIFDNVVTSVLGYSLTALSIEANKVVFNTKKRIKEKFEFTKQNITKGSLTSKESLLDKFKSLIPTLGSRNDAVVKAFDLLYDAYHQSGEVHEWFKELAIYIVSEETSYISIFNGKYVNDSFVFRINSYGPEARVYEFFFTEVIGCDFIPKSSYKYGTTSADALELVDKLKKYIPNKYADQLQELVKISCHPKPTTGYIPNLEVEPIKGTVKAPVVTMDFLNEKLKEWYKGEYSRDNEPYAEMATSFAGIEENPDFDSEDEYGDVTSSGIPYYLVKGAGDGAQNWTYAFVYWDGTQLAKYYPARGNTVLPNEDRDLVDLFDSRIEDVWDFYKNLFKSEDLIWPLTPYDGDAEDFIQELAPYLVLDKGEMIEDFEKSIEIIN